MRTGLILAFFVSIFTLNSWGSFYSRSLVPSETRKVDAPSYSQHFKKTKNLYASIFNLKKTDKITDLFSHENFKSLYGGNGSGLWIELSPEEVSRSSVNKYSYFLVLSKKPIKFQIEELSIKIDPSDSYSERVFLRGPKKVNSYSLNEEGSKREHWFNDLDKNSQYDLVGDDNFNLILRVWAKRKSLVESFHEVNAELTYETGLKENIVFLMSPSKFRQFSKGVNKEYFSPSIPFIIDFKKTRGFLKSIKVDSSVSIEIAKANKLTNLMSSKAKVPSVLRKSIEAQAQAQNFFKNQDLKTYNWLSSNPYATDYYSQFKLSNMSAKNFLSSNGSTSLILPSKKISLAVKKPFYKIYSSDYSNKISTNNEMAAFQKSKDFDFNLLEPARYYDIKTIHSSESFQVGKLFIGPESKGLILGPFLKLYFTESNSVKELGKMTLSQSLAIDAASEDNHEIRVKLENPAWLSLGARRLTDRKVAISNWIEALGDIELLNKYYEKTYYQKLLMGEFYSAESLLSQIELFVSSGKIKEALGLCYSKKVSPKSLRTCFYLAVINKRMRYAELLLKRNKNQFDSLDYTELKDLLYFEKFNKSQLMKRATELEKILLEKINLISFKKAEVLQKAPSIVAIEKNEQKKVRLYQLGNYKKINLNPNNEYEFVIFFDNASLIYGPKFSLMSRPENKKSYPVIRTKEPSLKNVNGEYLTKGQTFSVSGVDSLAVESNVKAYYKLYQVITYKHQDGHFLYSDKLKYKSVGRTFSIDDSNNISEVKKINYYGLTNYQPTAQKEVIKLKFKSEDEAAERNSLQKVFDLCLSAQSVGKKFTYLNKIPPENPFYSRCARTIDWKEKDPFNRDNKVKINSSTVINEVSSLININKHKKSLMNGFFIASPEKNYKVTKSKDNGFMVNYKIIIPKQEAKCKTPSVYLESSLGKQEKKDIKLEYGDSLVFETKNSKGCIYLISAWSEDSALIYSSDALSVRKFESNYKVRLNPNEALKLNRYIFDRIESQHFYNSSKKATYISIECPFICYDKYYFGSLVKSSFERNAIEVIEFEAEDLPASKASLVFPDTKLVMDDISRRVKPSSLHLDYTYRTLDQEFGGSGLFKKVLESNPASTYFLRYRKKYTSQYIHLFAGLSDIQESDILNYELGLNINGTITGVGALIDSYRLQFKAAYADGFDAEMLESRLTFSKKYLVGHKSSLGIKVNGYYRGYKNELMRGPLFLREYFSNYQLSHKNGASLEFRADKKLNFDKSLARYSVAAKFNEFSQNKILDRLSHGFSYSHYAKNLESRIKLSQLYYLEDKDRTEASKDHLLTLSFKYDNYFKGWGGLSPFVRATYYDNNKEYAFRLGTSISLDSGKPFYHHASHENAFLKFKRSSYEY